MTSLKIPNAGKITIYTSGCPQIQKLFAQSISIPPFVVEKNCVPKRRSNIICASETVKVGNANNIMTHVIRADQVNMGIFQIDIPGALILIMVTMKLIPVSYTHLTLPTMAVV